MLIVPNALTTLWYVDGRGAVAGGHVLHRTRALWTVTRPPPPTPGKQEPPPEERRKLLEVPPGFYPHWRGRGGSFRSVFQSEVRCLASFSLFGSIGV